MTTRGLWGRGSGCDGSLGSRRTAWEGGGMTGAAIQEGMSRGDQSRAQGRVAVWQQGRQARVCV